MDEFVQTIVKYKVREKEFYTEEEAHSYLLDLKNKEKKTNCVEGERKQSMGDIVV